MRHIVKINKRVANANAITANDNSMYVNIASATHVINHLSIYEPHIIRFGLALPCIDPIAS